MTSSKQETYYRVYRNRQSWLHHLAYMRLSKVFALLYALEQRGISLEGKRIFDYGFGAGTFFRYCPKQSYLYGVELDPVNVNEASASLQRNGYAHADLRPVEETRWREHELLNGQYDIIVISHVLEHLKKPEELLERLVSCLSPEGCILAALPINELVVHTSHEHIIQRNIVEQWAHAAGAVVDACWELDSFTYYALPMFEKKSLPGRVLAQGLSLCFGMVAAILGRRLWFKLDKAFMKLSRAKPAQAIYLMRVLQK